LISAGDHHSLLFHHHFIKLLLPNAARLDPDIKQQHHEDSLKCYSKKQVLIFSIFLLRTDIILVSCRNADKLREAARL
jgi:hypothetical protein